jgi:putative transposase
MKFDPQKHHRRSIRLKGYDYSLAGAYFVTACSWQREPLFGSIENGMVRLSPIGKILQEEWFKSGEIRQEICLFDDQFVIMPNHIHGIVWIVEILGADGVCPEDDGVRQKNDPVGTGGACPELGDRRSPRHLTLPKKSLGSFMAGFKSAATRRAREECNQTGIWQRNHYEHIIRNEAELDRIQHYILANPANWSDDQENPARN